MMNRREAIVVLSAAALGAAVAPAAPLGPPFPEVLHDEGSPAASSHAALSNAAIDKRLRADLEHLSPRVNSEEGVPVFLACVNLLGSKTSPPVAATPLISPNAAMAAEFRQDAAAWGRIRPNAHETEVGKLIEVLAYRDFSSGGREPAS